MSYLVDIGGALDALGSEFTVSDQLDLHAVDLGEDHFQPSGPASFDVTLTNTGAGIVASGSASATLVTTCARCLNHYDLEVVAPVEAFYVEHGQDAQLPEEQEIEYVEDGKVDLEPAVAQAVVVDLPFAPLCSEDCLGLCPVCGADLNEAPCDCPRGQADGPFAALGDLIPTKPEELDE